MNYNLYTIRMCRGGGGLQCHYCQRYQAYMQLRHTPQILRPVVTNFVKPLDPTLCDEYFLPTHKL